MNDPPPGTRSFGFSGKTAIIAIACLFLSEMVANGQSYVWDKDKQGKWEDANYWMNHTVPGPDANVYLFNNSLDPNACIIDDATGCAYASDIYFEASPLTYAPYSLWGLFARFCTDP